MTVNVGLRMKCRRQHPFLSRTLDPHGVISGRLETKGVTSAAETVSMAVMAPLEDTDDLRMSYLLR